ncbi:MAG: hypothetical protein JJE46_08130 [Acidimicrobiia bacterium]|nr:hypothetical protein [Acidimicrobiia bacterium]
MSRRSVRTSVILLGIGLLVAGCGSGTEETTNPTNGQARTTKGTAADTEFCKTLAEMSALLEPDAPDAEPTPEQTKTDFDTVASLLARAREQAPPALTADVGTFATAIDKYRTALADVGYNLGAIYATPEGIALANDTSHALSPGVVRHMTGPCGISPNGGEQRKP